MNLRILRLRHKLVIFILLLMISPCVYGQDETASDADEEIEVTKPEPIPLSKLSSESEIVLRNIASNYLPSIRTDAITRNERLIDSATEHMKGVNEITQYAVEQNFPTEIRQIFVSQWEIYLEEIDYPLNLLNDYAKKLEQIQTNVTQTAELWLLTKQSLTESASSTPNTVERVDFILAKLDSVSEEAADSLDNAVTLQNRLVDLRLKATTIQNEQISSLGSELGSLISRRGPPIWKTQGDSISNYHLAESREFYNQFNRTEARTYLSTYQSKFIGLGIFMMLFYLALRWMRIRIREIKNLDKEILTTGEAVFKRPVFAAMLFSTICSIPFFSMEPLYLKAGMVLIILVSFAFLIPHVVNPNFRIHFFLFSGLYLLAVVQTVVLNSSVNLRVLELVESSLLLAFFIWYRKSQQKNKQTKLGNKLSTNVLLLITPLFTILAAIAIVGNIFGYIHMSYVLNTSLVTSFYIAALFGVAYSSLTAILVIFVHTKIAELSHLIVKYRNYIINRIRLIFQLLFIFFWLRFTLKSLYLLLPIKKSIQSFLNIGVQLEETFISIESVLHFFLIIIASWLIGNFIRLLLQDEVLSRFKLQRGVPMAVASITYYTLLTIGFLFALTSLGFNLTQLGVLAGALGIGIGFGLQNLVGNFISGLILIFERPIAVGDVVDLQNIEGQVISIGIRSSKVKKYDGSIMIVPNYDLISQKVINFSFTDQTRRCILLIHTNVNVDPEQVLKIMQETALTVDGVLSSPAASSYFQGTENQSKLFKLYYWLHMDRVLDVQSAVALKVHQKLKEHGIEVREQQSMELTSRVAENDRIENVNTSDPSTESTEQAGNKPKQ